MAKVIQLDNSIAHLNFTVPLLEYNKRITLFQKYKKNHFFFNLILPGSIESLIFS